MSTRALLTTAGMVAALALQGCGSTSKYQGLDAAGVFRLAQQELAEEDWGNASETLDRLLISFPDFERAEEAQFLLAEAYFRDEQYITAASEYARFLDRYPGSSRAPEAALGICQADEALSPITQRDQTYTDQALSVCRNVVTDYPGHPAAAEAAAIANGMRAKLARKLYDNGGYYLRRNLYDSAIIYFEDVVEQYPETEWAPRALASIIEAYTAIGYEDEVETARNRLLSQYPDSPEAKEHRSPSGETGAGGPGR